MLNGFDNWYAQMPESPEMPSGADILEHTCCDCNGYFTSKDIESENYKIDYEFEINGWIVAHIDCEKGMLPL